MSHTFQDRHLGPRADDVSHMLASVGARSLDGLIDEIIPGDIRLPTRLVLTDAESEFEYLRRLRRIASQNRVCRSYIGLGYHDTITPAVIQRNVFENPGWYTPYTPYQAEIAQGRLESLLNFQTMVADLTGMQVANASLLDEATAAAEAMTLLLRVHKRAEATTFLVSDRVFPHVLAVLETRAEPLGIRVQVTDVSRAEFRPDVYGMYVQSPDDRGEIADLRGLIARAHRAGVLVGVGTDLLALALVTPPGEAGADVVVGNAQRFGVPLGYGGPARGVFRHARRLRPAGARPHHRRVGRQPETAGVPHGAADPRAAYSPREGDIEYLHGPGAAGQHGRVLRRLPWPGWIASHRWPRAWPGGRPCGRRDVCRLAPNQSGVF